MYFRQIFLIAFLTALVTSLSFSIYQHFFVTPLIFAAEIYEIADAVDIDTIIEAESWAPNDGIERTLYTLLANFLMSLAYSLLLASAMVFSNTHSTLKGFLWGIAGYLSLFVAPSFGLPPEIPGMEAADLNLRQNWWLLSVALTAIGFAITTFSPFYYKGAGIVFIILPYLVGAPTAEIHGFAHPDPAAVAKLTDLWHQFIQHTYIANGLLWLIIGTTTGYLCQKYMAESPSLQPKFN